MNEHSTAMIPGTNGRRFRPRPMVLPRNSIKPGGLLVAGDLPDVPYRFAVVGSLTWPVAAGVPML